MATAEAKAKMTMNSKPYEKGVGKAEKANKGFGKSLKSLNGLIVGAFSIGAITQFGSKILSAGSQLEDFEQSFKALGMSAEEAVAFVKELSEFSAVTPFSLESLVEASQQLFVMTEGVLGGTKSLKLFGDVAAATGNKDLAGLAGWIGRLYGNLKAGQPIRDSLTALQRLKVVTPTVLVEMIKMTEAGEDGSKIWDVFTESLGKFDGAMEGLSATVSGKTSTMKDNWVKAFGAMGRALEPITKVALDKFTKFAGVVERFVKRIQVVHNIIQAFGARALGKNKRTFEEVAASLKLINEIEGKGGGTETGIAGGIKLTSTGPSKSELDEAKRKADAAKKKADADKKAAADAAKEAAKAEERLTKKKAKLAKDLKDIATGKGVSVSGQMADRLARIGGQVGGQASPLMRVAERELQVQKQIKDFIATLPKDIAKELGDIGAMV